MKGTRRQKRIFTSSLISLLVIIALSLSVSCFAQKRATESKAQEEQTVKQFPAQVNPYTTIFYKSGGLNIEAYFYKPAGTGPFPLVIYNHGSRQGHERQEVPFKYVAEMLTANGYAVLVPERRGYGKSDGPTFSEEVASAAQPLMQRFNEEADDVLAGLEYLRSTAHDINFNRVALMGWSHGGVVSILAASRNHSFVAIIDQAGGALTWKHSTELQTALTQAARKITVPGLCQDAENDATTDAVKMVGNAIRAAGNQEKTIIYPAFTPTSNPDNIAPGHLIFSRQGIQIWQNDVLSFLRPIMKS
ncbi:MAG TPA: alpha/beta fold hydrolase [Pyrinomonadaceae bacterium]|nr:alpha/beta fold hydrolase [Pyrinomonadaceae bacterium]